jgi:glycolate oxidase
MTSNLKNSSEAQKLAALQSLLPGRILSDPDVTQRYCHDEAEWAPYGQALAVVRPNDTTDVQTAIKFCIEAGVNVVPRGAGTGLSGGANAPNGSLVISLEEMDSILEINTLEHYAVVQPGVINADLREACAEHGLWFPPDPSSAKWSTIGGNVATNAGGLCCVKYGVTRDYVLGLEMVTGLGDIVRLGRRTAKGVAGYDLSGLLVGSEGTLGVITEITVRLKALRPPEKTIVGYFSSIVDAGNAVTAVATSGVTPSALELIDHHCLAAVDAWMNLGLSVDADVVLLGRTDAPGVAGDSEAALILAAFEQSGATWAAVSTDEEQSEALFEARRLAYPALERLGPVLTEDVCVPISMVPEMLARIEMIAVRHDTLIANVAHAGDGNLHPLLIAAPDDMDAKQRAILAFEDILNEALSLGGTVTGEHGVGLLKVDGLSKELSSEVLDMHRAIKDALDPHGIMNVGKVFSSNSMSKS